MRKYNERENLITEIKIKKTFDCDVIVIGGDVAGFGVAMGATQSGAKTILIEENSYLGGCAATGLVAPFIMICYDSVGD